MVWAEGVVMLRVEDAVPPDDSRPLRRAFRRPSIHECLSGFAKRSSGLHCLTGPGSPPCPVRLERARAVPVPNDLFSALPWVGSFSLKTVKGLILFAHLTRLRGEGRRQCPASCRCKGAVVITNSATGVVVSSARRSQPGERARLGRNEQCRK